MNPSIQAAFPSMRQFATWDTVNVGTGFSFSNRNLDAVGSGWHIVRATLGKSIDKWFCGYQFQNAGTYPMVGFCNGSANLNYYLGADTNSWGYYGYDGRLYNSGTSYAYGSTFNNGDVIELFLDCVNNQFTFYKNGTSQGAVSNTLSGQVIYPASNDYSAMTIRFNPGDTAFTASVPAGCHRGIYI